MIIRRARALGQALGTAAVLLLTLLACKKGGVRDESKVARAGAPAEVSLSTVTKELDCDKAPAKTPTGEACRVAKDFASGTPVTAWPSSGRTVWFGRTYRIVTGEAPSASPYFLQVEPGTLPALSLSMNELKFVLPVVGCARDLIPENATEKADAEAVLLAVGAGKPVPDSPAVKYMRTAAPTNGFHAMANSAGASAIVVAQNRSYIRQKGERLVMVEPHSKGGGWFAELWKLP